MDIPTEHKSAASFEKNSNSNESGSLTKTPGEVFEIPAQGLQKPFNIWSTLGIAFSTTSVPIAIGTYLSISVGVGGSPVYIFAYIVASVMNLGVCASLAEVAAVYPHSSGTHFRITLHRYRHLFLHC